MSSINKRLFFPDSTVCTLLVKDLNDKTFHCSILPDSEKLYSPGHIQQGWPGSCTLLEETFDTKSILLKIDPTISGIYKGEFIISDQQDAFTSLPYEIITQFFEPFDSHPLYSPSWQLFNRNDTSTIKIDYTDKKLLFIFDTTGSNSGNSTGLVSSFRLAGSFSITIDFKIRDDMGDGFETGFFVSTSNDTGKWSGDIAGIYLQGNQNRIRLECKSVNLQSFSKEVDFFSGKIGISRDSDNVDFFYHDNNPSLSPVPLTRFAFSAEDTVFVHIKMVVKDRKRIRHSLWNDFYVTKGHIVPHVN
jgi:hypothetical protein